MSGNRQLADLFRVAQGVMAVARNSFKYCNQYKPSSYTMPQVFAKQQQQQYQYQQQYTPDFKYEKQQQQETIIMPTAEDAPNINIKTATTTTFVEPKMQAPTIQIVTRKVEEKENFTQAEGAEKVQQVTPPTSEKTATEAQQQQPQQQDAEQRKVVFKERSIPSSPFSRMFHFGNLAVQLAGGTVSGYVKRKLFGDETQQQTVPVPEQKATISNVSTTAQSPPPPNVAPPTVEQKFVDQAATPSPNSHYSTAKPAPQQTSSLKSAILTEANAERLANTLCRMRGAALKLGQLLSMQDQSMIPEPIAKALDRVRHQADIMPRKQLEKQLVSELGANWQQKFAEFEMVPIAAASIGQVHRGTLKDGRKVAIKVQYPGVAESIDSDIKNLNLLVTYTNLFPPGAFIHQTMDQARKELKDECDYSKEATNQRKFRDLIYQFELNDRFYVPQIIDELTTKRILTSELIPAQCKSIETLAATASQQTRNEVAQRLLDLCLKELFEFRFMQTDPNWSNFYYDASGQDKRLYLLDFGACLSFPKRFTDDYLRIVYASAMGDKQTIVEASRRLGFLTGEETPEMNDAHARAAIIVGDPFAKPGIYDFRNQESTKQIQTVIPTMLKYRLTAPPPISYSLHRKLSGSFLLCFKLGALFDSRQMFMNMYNQYKFD